ncbi:unnamed protein product [Phaedon cochleariae]|uniref:Uncharacterized protein n=1 Tax=Phaedon cochleariae TaxID=80249 RepID=A0A9N9SB07_PHACE|nr:unnamed protein product [Phaedon cochleariae]
MSKLRCTGKEGLQRMNYLYQISNMLATNSVAENTASSLNSNLLVNISRKTVQRMEIGLKRTICKSCRCLLLAGINCKIRITKKKLIQTCLKCHKSKILSIENKTYLPWTQQEESIVEVMDFGKSSETQGDNDIHTKRNKNQVESIHSNRENDHTLMEIRQEEVIMKRNEQEKQET